ncbi:hypothetical protein EI94DRAFT_1830198 [Lactarius quietus]|nr:hypothetical protein EI94DRAFT_1830198 [Lactarius quietus]
MSLPPAERTIDEIIEAVERFRILVIGRSGVGKSSLINCVFGIKIASVENDKVGYADIEKEFVSEENKLFVLHDSKGFESGDHGNFDTVRSFVEERLQKPLLKDRIHGIWLCVETPTAGGRVFETGDEKLLEFAHEKGVPLVLVFTQYDRLERTKAKHLRGKPNMDKTSLRHQSIEDAEEAFETCLKTLKLKPDTPMPTYAKVSDYIYALAGSLSVVRQWILRDCLKKVHNDIITCWNFKDEGKVLKSPEFQELMFCLVDGVQTQPSAKSPNVDEAFKYVTLTTFASASLAGGPAAASASVAALPAEWLTITLEKNISEAGRMLVTYIVDLVKVLIELFGITLRADLALTTRREELHQAFEAYKTSPSCQSIHKSIRSKKRWIGDDVGTEISHLLEVDKYYVSGS